MYLDTDGWNFGQRLRYWREEAGMTRPAACKALKAHKHKTTTDTLKRWEKAVNPVGRAKVIATLSFIYISHDSEWVGNLNWLYNSVGLPYSANLTGTEQCLIKDLRDLPWRSRKATAGLLGAFGKDYTRLFH